LSNLIDNETKSTVEIVVHITDELNEEQRSNLASVLENTNGIEGAEFCPLRYHLMLVRYDTDMFSSKDVLKKYYLRRCSGPVDRTCVINHS